LRIGSGWKELGSVLNYTIGDFEEYCVAILL
jgi:hypothetical protein